MKLINHNKNNGYNMKDGAFMRGTIEMTAGEFSQACEYLQKKKKEATKKCITQIRDGLAHGYEIEHFPAGIFISYGVTATRLIVDYFNLKGYKEQNYAIKLV
jgi:hypothetical protein